MRISRGDRRRTNRRPELFAAVLLLLLLGAIGGLHLHMDNKFDGVMAKFDGVDGKFDGVEGRLRSIEIEAAKTNAKLDQLLERTGPKPDRR